MSVHRHLLTGAAAVALLAAAPAAFPDATRAAGGAPPVVTARVSLSTEGLQLSEGSTNPRLDPTGRFVVYEVAGSSGGIFLNDLKTGAVQRLAPPATVSGGAYKRAAISSGGHKVAIRTNAALLPGDTNGRWDIYVLDRDTGGLTLATVSSAGALTNKGSVHATEISGDGEVVAFHANATNLVPGDTNSGQDVFVHDLLTGATTRASVATDGTQANGSSTEPALSFDGRYVVFQSTATNLGGPGPRAVEPAAGEDDSCGGDEGPTQVYLRDREDGTTVLVSVGYDGQPANGVSSYPSISANGRYVAFQSAATNLVPGMTQAAAATVQPLADEGGCGGCSGDEGGGCGGGGDGGMGGGEEGGHVLPPPGQVYVRDMVLGVTRLVSVSYEGGPAGSLSAFQDAAGEASRNDYPAISADGRHVAFRSSARDLVSGAQSGHGDIYLRDLGTGTTTRMSVAGNGALADGDSGSSTFSISISRQGELVAFDTSATNLVAGDTNGEPDCFVRGQILP